jgi:hypothetical protein
LHDGWHAILGGIACAAVGGLGAASSSLSSWYHYEGLAGIVLARLQLTTPYDMHILHMLS